MKRAALGVLIFTLVALPSLAGSAKTRRSAVTYRGEGTFAGWSQQEMNDVYQALIPITESVPEIMQLG